MKLNQDKWEVPRTKQHHGTVQAEDQPGKIQLCRKYLSVLGNKLKVELPTCNCNGKNVTENHASLRRAEPAGPWKRLLPSTGTGTASTELFEAAQHKRNIGIVEQVQQMTTSHSAEHTMKTCLFSLEQM